MRPEVAQGAMERDRLGRRRSPEQERGLRPLHPPLPEEWVSKVLRVAMPESDWERFETLAGRLRAGRPDPGPGQRNGDLGPAACRVRRPVRSRVRWTGWTGSAARRSGLLLKKSS